MSTIAVLVGLLALALYGSARATDRTGVRMATTGIEYVVLGVLVGPHTLRLVDSATVDALGPLAAVGLGWQTFVLGADYPGREATRRSVATGVGLGLVTAAAAGGVAWWMLRDWAFEARIVIALGAAAVAADTARQAVGAVAKGDLADGSLAKLLRSAATADDIVPLALVAAAFGLVPLGTLAYAAPPWSLAVASPALGIAVGVVAALLLRSEPSVAAAWGILLGALLLTAGIAYRMGLSALTAAFFMGCALAVLTAKPRREDLRAELGRTEHAVLLPTLTLAGAQIDPGTLPAAAWPIAAILGARILARLVAGPVVGRAAATKANGLLLGAALLPGGSLVMCIGLAFSFRFPGAVGDTVLSMAAAVMLLGEVAGRPALARLLAGASREAEPPSATPEAT